jgi:ATP-dependent DNA helicase RecG
MSNQEIHSELQFIKGIGPQRAKALAKENIFSLFDLAAYFPRDYIDRSSVSSLRSLNVKLRQDFVYDGKLFKEAINLKNEVTVVASIKSKVEKRIGRNRKMLSVELTDESGGSAFIIYWSYTDYYKKLLKDDQLYIISGRVELDKFQKIVFNHPEIDEFNENDEQLFRGGTILPVYRMTQELKNARWSMKLLRNVVQNALETVIDSFEESLPDALLTKYNFPTIQTAVSNLHFPENTQLLQVSRERMKFEEIFFFQLLIAFRSRGVKEKERGQVFRIKSPLARQLYDDLPFELTGDQKKVIREIAQDFESGKAMSRLLQGDVGSGKTIVAVLSMLIAIENGYQVAIMAPTEVLAEQHHALISNLIQELDLNIVSLTGSQGKKLRREVLERISSGEANIIVGTHAMVVETVEYNNLAYIVIDEQHRFGVEQRAKLKALGNRSMGNTDIVPHILLMSATPIPRTLSLTLYGDLEQSFIKEMPSGRKPIKTRVTFENDLFEVYSFVQDEVTEGRQAYIIYPLVEKSEKLDLKAAVEQFDDLNEEVFPDLNCGLIHGQMKWSEKESVMHDFKDKKYDILVATTVIEVGIDVPNATVMIINNAERFGLATLHQLRGRVGRDEAQSYCVLVTKDNYRYDYHKKEKKDEERKAAIIRLKTMEETTDGFKISEIDMKLRGHGDLAGTRQSGLPIFRFINLMEDEEIIANARNEAKIILETDPQLRSPENHPVRRNFVKLYGKEQNYFGVG